MKICPVLIACALLLLVSFGAYAKLKEQKALDNIFYYSPDIVNDKYTGYELGFISNKKIKKLDYNYYAFASFIVMNEQYRPDDNLSAGALGFKGGVLLPTQPWVHLYLHLAVGFAKTSLQHDPFFGKTEQSLSSEDMFYYECGVVIRQKQFLAKVVFQDRSVDYFYRDVIFSLGVNF